MWTVFKDFIEFVINKILLLFYVLVSWPQDMWGLRSLIRNGTCLPCTESQSL